MSKTEKTKELERSLWQMTKRPMGLFSCFEVTIGWNGTERVDYLTYDSKGTWRCYEIKTSVSDFHSKCKNTFIGHYNYYVMTKAVYDKVKDEIPSNIGVFIETDNRSLEYIKTAKKQELLVDEQVLKDSMIRSLNREAELLRENNDELTIRKLNRKITQLEKEKRVLNIRYKDLHLDISDLYGHNWHRKETSNTLKYKGYRGTVEYSAATHILCGHVVGEKFPIYYGKSLEELENNFHKTIEDQKESDKK